MHHRRVKQKRALTANNGHNKKHKETYQAVDISLGPLNTLNTW